MQKMDTNRVALIRELVPLLRLGVGAGSNAPPDLDYKTLFLDLCALLTPFLCFLTSS